MNWLDQRIGIKTQKDPIQVVNFWIEGVIFWKDTPGDTRSCVETARQVEKKKVNLTKNLETKADHLTSDCPY